MIYSLITWSPVPEEKPIKELIKIKEDRASFISERESESRQSEIIGSSFFTRNSEIMSRNLLLTDTLKLKIDDFEIDDFIFDDIDCDSLDEEQLTRYIAILATKNRNYQIEVEMNNNNYL